MSTESYSSLLLLGMVQSAINASTTTPCYSSLLLLGMVQSQLRVII